VTDPESILDLAAGRNRQSQSVEQHPAHILIVDDDPRVRSLETAVLHAHGFTSAQCSSGLEALRVLDETCFDAVLLDIRMPGIDGWEVLRLLRERDYDGPVLIVSADATEDEASTRGADGMLRKPFTIAELVGTLRTVLRGRSLCAIRPTASKEGVVRGWDREPLLARAS
jgi:two-component system OmpR family response regulator